MSTFEPALNAAIAQLLQDNLSLGRGEVVASVRNGWVTLQGRVRWPFQRQAAEDRLLDLPGVKGLTNEIEVRVLPTLRNREIL